MWGTTARIGDAVEIFGPRGKVRLAEAGWQLFVGDESALPAISEMLLALPDTANVVALIEIQDAADEQLLSSPAHLDLRWLHRGATLAGSAQPLVSALARVELVNPDRHAYVFGESRVVKQLRDDLAGRGFRPDQVSAKGYWNMFARHARSEGNHHVT
jgi:NADPH-dependent ferric siderophore reductase